MKVMPRDHTTWKSVPEAEAYEDYNLTRQLDYKTLDNALQN